MKKQSVCLVLTTALLSATLASCSLSGTNTPAVTQPSQMSYSEKASYYDALVAGDSDPIPLTTALNSSVSIEGDSNLLEDDLYEKIVEIANQVYPLICGRYTPNSVQSITITLDASSASYTPCYAVGSTVLLNTDWLNNHPKECDVLIDGFSSVVFNYSHTEKMPSWLLNAMKAYVRDEYALYRSESSFRLPKRYNGKSYETSKETGAAFLKWIKDSQHVDIMLSLNRQLRSSLGYKDTVWKDATGKTFEQLWHEYQNA